MKTKQGSSAYISPVFLFICFGCLSILLMIFIFRWVQFFTPMENLVPLHVMSASKMRELAIEPEPVKVGLFLNNFPTFDMTNDKFIFDGVLSFEFNPSIVSLKTVEQISFERGTILHKSSAISKFIQGNLFVHYDIRVEFSTNLNYKLFPFEDHRIAIVLIHKKVSPRDIIFHASNASFVVPNMSQLGWYKFSQNVESGYLEEQLEQGNMAKIVEYPAVAFYINYGRYLNVRNILAILMPMLFLFFICTFSLILDSKEYFSFVISIPVQTIVGLIAFRFVIETSSPKVGYFMYSDYLFFLFLFLMFCILLINAFADYFGILARKLLIVGFNGIIALVFMYLLATSTWT